MLRSLRLTSHTRSTSCRCTERSCRSAMARRSACNCLRSVSLSRVGSKDILKESLMAGLESLARIVRLPPLHCSAADMANARRTGRTLPGTAVRRWARRARTRMFGGHGLRVDGVFIALIAFERLYLKVDDTSRPQFAAAGCEPFVYAGKGKPVTMSYWTVPPQAMDSPEQMRPWARLALDAALRATATKRRPGAGPPRPQRAARPEPPAASARWRRPAHPRRHG